ncbi:MAG: hypothetical protein RL748_1610 [Pseudomonadota bacterium]|jgi:hypothetical protein
MFDFVLLPAVACLPVDQYLTVNQINEASQDTPLPPPPAK